MEFVLFWKNFKNVFALQILKQSLRDFFFCMKNAIKIEYDSHMDNLHKNK